MLNEKGFSMVELIVVLGAMSIMALTAISDVKTLDNSLSSTSNGLLGYLKVARTKAVGTTQAYNIIASGPYSVRAEVASSCDSATWTADPTHSYDLPSGVSLVSTTFSVCFGPRGFTDGSEDIELTDGSQLHTLEVFQAGAVRLVK